jgi:hypothetical protein
MRYCESLSLGTASADHALSSSCRMCLRSDPSFILFLAESLEGGERARVEVGARVGLSSRLWWLDASL